MTGPAPTRAQQETTAYGFAPLLDDGDLVITAGELQLISGRAALEQGVTLAIGTPWGTDRLNTTYGLDVVGVFTAGLTRDLTKQVLRLSLIRTVSQDPRIAAVDQVAFDDDPEYLAAHPGTTGGSDRRTALVEITARPVSPGAPPVGSDVTAALAAQSGSPDTVSFLADVRW